MVTSRNHVKGATNQTLSGSDDQDSRDSQYTTVMELKKTIAKQTIALGKQSEVSKMIVAVSLAVGGLLSGAGVALQGQMAPESWLQSSMSVLAKKFSDNKTGFEIVQEAKPNSLLVVQQAKTLKSQSVDYSRIQEINKLQDELIGIQKFLMAGLQEKLTNLESGQLTCGKASNISPLTGAPISKTPESPAGKAFPVPETSPVSEIFTAATKLKNEVSAELNNPELVVHIRQMPGNHVHASLVYRGKTSLGFYAEMPQFKNRLTDSGMKQWIRDSVRQLDTVGLIESIGRSKHMGTKDSTIGMRIKKRYTGEIEVAISDAFTGKSSVFVVDPKIDTETGITEKIDIILSAFLES